MNREYEEYKSKKELEENQLLRSVTLLKQYIVAIESKIVDLRNVIQEERKFNQTLFEELQKLNQQNQSEINQEDS